MGFGNILLPPLKIQGGERLSTGHPVFPPGVVNLDMPRRTATYREALPTREGHIQIVHTRRTIKPLVFVATSKKGRHKENNAKYGVILEGYRGKGADG